MADGLEKLQNVQLFFFSCIMLVIASDFSLKPIGSHSMKVFAGTITLENIPNNACNLHRINDREKKNGC